MTNTLPSSTGNSRKGTKKVLGKILVVLLGLTVCFLSNIYSATIPYPTDLSKELKAKADVLITASVVNPAKALTLANTFFSASDEMSVNGAGWSLNYYAELLLFNDSIAKAEDLLMSFSAAQRSLVKPEIQDYTTLNLGRIYSFQGNYSQADSCFRKVLSRSNGSILKLHSTQALAENLRYQGKLDQSLIRWYQGLKISEEMADSSEIVQVHLGIGTIRFLRDELEKAKESFEMCHGYYRRLGNEKELGTTISLLGLIDYKNEKYQECIEKNLSGYAIRKQINDLKGQGESLNNLALGYMGMSNWNQALQYLQQAVQLKTIANDLTQMTVILNNMGHCYGMLNEKELSLKYFKLALAKGDKNGQMGDVLNSYQNIIRLHYGSKDFELALKYQTSLIEFKDSVAKETRNQAIRELEVKYETEKKEQEIIMLKQESAMVTNRWLTLALALFLAIIIGVLFIDSQKRKHRQAKLLHDAEDDLHKAELQNMTSQLEFNQNKLSFYTENLLKKNELVGQLEQRLKNSVDFSLADSSENKQLIEDFSAVRILTDNDWKEFKVLFGRVHNGLLERLNESYENLTLGEQRLFLLMKLELSTKEIANILGVSPESIKKGRYRLKKKIGVDEATTLQEFVSQF